MLRLDEWKKWEGVVVVRMLVGGRKRRMAEKKRCEKVAGVGQRQNVRKQERRTDEKKKLEGVVGVEQWMEMTEG